MSLIYAPKDNVYERKHLNRIPYPTIKQTCEKYLNTVTVLAENEKEIQCAKEAVNEFLSKDGPILQQDLEALSKETSTSYIEGFWDTMYMELRDPVMINVSPWGLYKDDPRRTDQVERAASIMYSVARFAKKLEKGKVGDLVGMVHKGEMCVSQYAKILSSRIPQTSRDTRVYSMKYNHIHVICKGHHYIVGVMDERRKLVPEEQLIVTLKAILANAGKKGNAVHDVGYMTTSDRTSWATIRNLMLHDVDNRENFDKIDTALVTVILDPRSPKNLTNYAALTAHSLNGRHRWYDKCIQIPVYGNGQAGVVLEHSPIDGDTQHGFANWVIMDAIHRVPTHHTEIAYKPQFQSLTFFLTKPVRSAIRQAEVNARTLIKSLDLKAYRFEDFGSTFLKTLKISPNSCLQMAFQLAYYRMHLKPGSTYEAMNMKQFYHGRTATVRTVTKESLEFTKVFFNPCSTIEEKVAALRQATTQHIKNCKESMKGFGVDRHLYILQKLADQRIQRLPNLSMPKIFNDPLYARMKTDLITSSNMSGSAAVTLGGFGPTARHGFGCGYIMDPNSITLCITNYDGRAEIFLNMALQSLKDIRDVLMAHQGKQVPARL